MYDLLHLISFWRSEIFMWRNHLLTSNVTSRWINIILVNYSHFVRPYRVHNFAQENKRKESKLESTLNCHSPSILLGSSTLYC